MPLSRPGRFLTALVLAVAALGPASAADDSGDAGDDARRGFIAAPQQLSGTLQGKQFIAGPEVYVDARTDDDIFAAGGDVEIRTAEVLDIFAAGAVVDLTDVTAEDAILAGGTVSARGALSGDVIAAGGAVELGNTAKVAGDVLAAGGRVALAGEIAGDLRAAAGEIRIDGPVGGDVELAGERIILGPNAEIRGDLTYRSAQALQRMSGAQVAGQISRTTVERPELPGIVDMVLAGALGWFGVVVSGVALAALLVGAVPRLVAGASDTIAMDPWPSLGIGLLVLVGVPVAVPFLMATVVGIPIGILALLLYGALALVGVIAAALTIGKQLPWMGRRHAGTVGFGSRFGRAAGGIVLLALVGLLPFVGGFLILLATIFGLGAAATQSWNLVGRRA